MFSIWGLVAVVFVALLIYHGHLTQHETDQLFLNETTPSSVHQENDAVVRRMNMIQPILRVVGTLAGLMTIALAAFWLWQATHQI
jgi:hypothetical protein